MTPLWTAADAIRATGGTGPLDWVATGVSIDTRSLSPGDLFMALRGPNHDAHEFVGAAFERGAVAAMVDREIAGRATRLPLLRVGDTLTGLTALAAFARARSAGEDCCASPVVSAKPGPKRRSDWRSAPVAQPSPRRAA